MSQDLGHIFKNYKKDISVIRGKKYSFNLSNMVDSTGVTHPFYITTDPNGGEGFPGVITEGLNYTTEIAPDPSLSTVGGSFEVRSGYWSWSSNLGFSAGGSQQTDIYLRTGSILECGVFYSIELNVTVSAGNIRVYVGSTEGAWINHTGAHTKVYLAKKLTHLSNNWIL